jgi:predicted ATPase
VLNGIRLAVAQDAHPLMRQAVVINHLQSENGHIINTEILIDAVGGLSSWPRGFFDQIEKDLAAIIKNRRELGR